MNSLTGRKKHALSQLESEAAAEQPGTGKPGTNQSAPRTVHLFPHSHVHEGQFATTDQLYSGEDTSIYFGSVKDILDSTVAELLKDRLRTFTWADLKYFRMWWIQLDKAQQAKVKELVKRGQLDLVNGGWTVADETLTSYDQLLDNQMVGQQFLQKELGVYPKVTWSLESNGLSSGFAKMARDLGFDAMFYSQVKSDGPKYQVWRPDIKNFGQQKEILSLNIDQGGKGGSASYCWPNGFWIDKSYPVQDANLADDPAFETYVKAFYKDMSDYFATEKTNHAFRMFGCDMSHSEAALNYKVTDQLIKVWNKLGFNQTMKLLYSSPTKYVTMLAKINNDWKGDAWPVKKDEFSPVAANNSLWTGFYSSRPEMKKNVRDLARTFHSSLRLTSQAVLRQDSNSDTRVDQMMRQFNILDTEGNLLNNEAIGGTSLEQVNGYFNDKAREYKNRILDHNAALLVEKVKQHHNVGIRQLSGSLEYWQTYRHLASPYSRYNELLVVIQNPSIQDREELVQL